MRQSPPPVCMWYTHLLCSFQAISPITCSTVRDLLHPRCARLLVLNLNNLSSNFSEWRKRGISRIILANQLRFIRHCCVISDIPISHLVRFSMIELLVDTFRTHTSQDPIFSWTYSMHTRKMPCKVLVVIQFFTPLLIRHIFVALWLNYSVISWQILSKEKEMPWQSYYKMTINVYAWESGWEHHWLGAN